MFILPSLNKALLTKHSSFLKLTMLPIAMQPWNLFQTRIYALNFESTRLVISSFPSNVQIAKTHWIVNVLIIGSVHDERCLSNVRFMKTKFTNRLTIHLDLVVRMFAHKLFTSDAFSFLAVISIFHRHSDSI